MDSLHDPTGSPRLFFNEWLSEKETRQTEEKMDRSYHGVDKQNFCRNPGSRTQPWIVDSIGAAVFNGGGPTTTEWDSSATLFRRWTFRRWNVKCVFLWNVTKVQKFALPLWSV